MQVTTVGLDLAKNVFQVHGVNAKGKVVVRRRLRRAKVREFFAGLEPCLIGLEACGTAHFWVRELRALGHEVRIMPPSYVKAYVRRGKNDAVDAEAICEAVTRPSMRFVPVKTEDQQSALMLHKSRELLIRQQTMLVNALRAHMAELGLIAPQGRRKDRGSRRGDRGWRGRKYSRPGEGRVETAGGAASRGRGSDRRCRRRDYDLAFLQEQRGQPAPGDDPRGRGFAPRRRSRPTSPIRRSSGRGASSPRGWDWSPGRIPAVARSGSVAYRSRETGTSGNFSCSAPPARCAPLAPIGRRSRSGSTVCSSAGRRGWSPSPRPTRRRGLPGPCWPRAKPTALRRGGLRKRCRGIRSNHGRSCRDFQKGENDLMPTGRAGGWDTSPMSMRTDRVIMIETRSANFIRASGQVPRQQAGHMTAPDRGGNQVKFFLQHRGRPHMTP